MDVNKGKQDVQWKSEYNMGQYYFERYNEILKELDVLAFQVGKYDRTSLNYLRDYLSALRVLFNNLQAPMEEKLREEFKRLFLSAESAVKESFDKSTDRKIYIVGHRKLLRLHQYLLEAKQFMGLGLILTRKMSAKKKVKNLLHGGNHA